MNIISTKDIKKQHSHKKNISTIGMSIMIISTVMSLRGLASQASYGYTSIFWYAFSAILFLIPFSLVSAELAANIKGEGGVFRWVSEAFGPRWGWAAIFYVWIAMQIWFPSVLMFGAVSLAYAIPGIDPTILASNRYYTLGIVLLIFWLGTLNCFRGIDNATLLSRITTVIGTIIPGLLLITMGIIYISTGGVNCIPIDRPFFPDFTQYGTIVLAASIFLFFGGIEMQAVHINSLRKPQRDYPRAILIAVIIILLVFIAGTLSIAIVMPKGDFNILQSLLQAYQTLGCYIGLGWIGKLIAFMIILGVIGQVSVIIAGPSTGILNVGKEGYLPPFCQKLNSRGVHVNILLIQAALVSVLSLVLTIFPSVQSAYQVMSQMATIIYISLSLLVYIAYLHLRNQKNYIQNKTGFRIYGGKYGAYIVASIGIIAALGAIIISFFPPEQIAVGNNKIYVGTLIIGAAILFSLPFIIFSFRKPSWKQ